MISIAVLWINVEFVFEQKFSMKKNNIAKHIGNGLIDVFGK